MLLFNGRVLWKASKITSVLTSSTNVELIALSATAKIYMYFVRMLRNMNLDLEQETTIDCDNLQTTALLDKATPRLNISKRD